MQHCAPERHQFSSRSVNVLDVTGRSVFLSFSPSSRPERLYMHVCWTGEAAPGCLFDASQFETVTFASPFFATRDAVIVLRTGRQ
jgi:hypothetical protein